MERGRKQHGDDVQQRLFDCFVSYLVSKLKPLPKNVRQKAFDSLTRNRDDKEKLKRAVYDKWDN